MMTIISILEAIGIVGSSVYWLRSQMLEHLPGLLHQLIKKDLDITFQRLSELEVKVDLLRDRLETVERVLVDN